MSPLNKRNTAPVFLIGAGDTCFDFKYGFSVKNEVTGIAEYPMAKGRGIFLCCLEP